MIGILYYNHRSGCSKQPTYYKSHTVLVTSHTRFIRSFNSRKIPRHRSSHVYPQGPARQSIRGSSAVPPYTALKRMKNIGRVSCNIRWLSAIVIGINARLVAVASSFRPPFLEMPLCIVLAPAVAQSGSRTPQYIGTCSTLDTTLRRS
jgi:hypothetical protein